MFSDRDLADVILNILIAGMARLLPLAASKCHLLLLLAPPAGRDTTAQALAWTTVCLMGLHPGGGEKGGAARVEVSHLWRRGEGRRGPRGGQSPAVLRVSCRAKLPRVVMLPSRPVVLPSVCLVSRTTTWCARLTRASFSLLLLAQQEADAFFAQQSAAAPANPSYDEVVERFPYTQASVTRADAVPAATPRPAAHLCCRRPSSKRCGFTRRSPRTRSRRSNRTRSPGASTSLRAPTCERGAGLPYVRSPRRTAQYPCTAAPLAASTASWRWAARPASGGQTRQSSGRSACRQRRSRARSSTLPSMRGRGE